MVQQTRRVVEDYILYKIHSTLSVENYIPDGAAALNHENAAVLHGLPAPQRTPSRLNLSLRNIAAQYEQRYKETFPDLLEEIRSTSLTANDVHHIFAKVAKDLFRLPLKQTYPANRPTENGNIATASNIKYASVQGINTDDSHIKWGHVIALLVFAGVLAVRAVECRSPEAVDSIVSWVTTFFDTELSQWFAKKGGWENFAEWSKASEGRIDVSKENEFDPNYFSTGIRSVMSVGIVAACVGLGAFMMAKK